MIVAIGSSAGGMEAVYDLIAHLPADTGMAFVLIQHLDPHHHSILADLLAKRTSLIVKEASDGMPALPNYFYVIPPNTSLSLSGNVLHVGPREEAHGLHLPIDHFMRALASQKGHRAVGVILSGSGSDGSLGMAEIQAQGGVTFAQDEASARYSGMPRSAVAAGCVDHVLPPAAIARELARMARHPYAGGDHKTPGDPLTDANNLELHSIFDILRKSTGVDFTHYRQTTILRRIRRRMVLHKIDDINEYARQLRKNPPEIKALHQDILINVTSFFRDPGVFEVLRSTFFPAILKKKSGSQGLRIWTPGCSSGEETYSIAMLMLEFLGDGASRLPIQFFGTDVNDLSISKARAGEFPANISTDVSPGRLRRFFTEVNGGYRVSPIIRDMCIFAQHNVLNDPPFSHMDLICCRNLLIYMEPLLQNRILSLFHYALQPQGYLVLGSSEGIGPARPLFTPADRSHKVFSKKSTAARQIMSFSFNPFVPPSEPNALTMPGKLPDSPWNYAEAQKEFDRRILAQYSPASVFINEEFDIIHSRGNVERYLKLTPGRASLNLLKMVRQGLVGELRKAITRASKENTVVQKKNIQVDNRDKLHPRTSARDSWIFVNFDVLPLRLGALRDTYFMIVFQEASPPLSKKSGAAQSGRLAENKAASQHLLKTEQELAAMKEYLESVIQTLEATNEELQSANEEILSSNEELQSTNEEMETAKEELQSTNEELTTVNDELRTRHMEISQVNNDLTNLLSSIDIAVIMIGIDLTIRRFTPKAQKFLGLIPSDIGRPLANINPKIEITGLQSLVLRVMTDFRGLERELIDGAGIRYQFRVLPYRTLDNKIDGAVITIVDIAVDSVKPDVPRTH